MQSVINQELRDRQKLLQEILIPAPEAGIPVSGAMTGRVVALLPGVPLMNGVPGSKLSTRLEDIQEKFEESVRIGVRLCSPLQSKTGFSLCYVLPNGAGAAQMLHSTHSPAYLPSHNSRTSVHQAGAPSRKLCLRALS